MGDREFTEFEAAVHKSNRILNELEEEMGWQDRRSQSYAGFREVLHAIRDMMIPDEAIHFAAQLPMLLAGLFIDGWKPSKTPMKMKQEEFYGRIQENLPYSVDEGVAELARAVWRVLEKHISGGQLNHVLGNLPNDIASSIKSESRQTVGTR